MNLGRTIHNFVNPNQELDEKTPVEIAGVDKIFSEIGEMTRT